jgi:hypothetical protein
MEGTSGAAERVPLRGGTRKAALPSVSRKRNRGAAMRESGSQRTRSRERSRQARSCKESPEGGSTKQATPACTRHEQRQEVSEPIGLGRSSPRERSRWEVPSRGKLTSARPLARDVSAGRGVDVYVDTRSHPQRAPTERSRRDSGSARGLPRARSCGVLAVRGRARGSYRLQKSTEGAWPFTGPGTKSSRTTRMV